jgi:hypothetical protein
MVIFVAALRKDNHAIGKVEAAFAGSNSAFSRSAGLTEMIHPLFFSHHVFHRAAA